MRVDIIVRYVHGVSLPLYGDIELSTGLGYAIVVKRALTVLPAFTLARPRSLVGEEAQRVFTVNTNLVVPASARHAAHRRRAGQVER